MPDHGDFIHEVKIMEEVFIDRALVRDRGIFIAIVQAEQVMLSVWSAPNNLNIFTRGPKVGSLIFV